MRGLIVTFNLDDFSVTVDMDGGPAEANFFWLITVNSLFSKSPKDLKLAK